MTSSNGSLKSHTAAFVLLALGLSLAGFANAAQQLEEITIESGRMAKEVVGRSSSTGASIELINANYSDLDLSTHSGAFELQKRVEITAKSAYRELDRLFPLSVSRSGTQLCVNKAMNSAKVQVQAAVESAEEAHVAAK